MADVDGGIFSMTGEESNNQRSGDIGSLRGLSRLRCPPAVVITHDSDAFNPSSINPAAGDSLGCLKSGPLASSTLSLAEGRNGICTSGGPSRAGSPRHSKIHPSESSTLPKSCSSVAVFASDGQAHGGESQADHGDHGRQRKSKRSCCSERTKRTTLGFFLTTIICAKWVGMMHLLRWAYVIHLRPTSASFSFSTNDSSVATTQEVAEVEPTMVITDFVTANPEQEQQQQEEEAKELAPFNAPFITTWICAACNSFFFPLYVIVKLFIKRKRNTIKKVLLDALRHFQEKGLSALHFFTRSMFFCMLWVGDSYMLIYSMSTLDATAVMGLLSTSASFIYLLSWVILHEQFVGIRIVAVILCNTGIALLAYMDGVSKTSTLGGVVLASAAAAGLAVHKVLFKKLIGEVTMGQLTLFLTLVGLLNVLMLWPIGLTLYLVQAETIVWNDLPYPQLGGFMALLIVGNVICNFEVIRNYETFLKLGLVSAVPVSAVLDVHLYHVVFEGMKLAGIILVCIGFILVLLPDNWPDYITRILRWRWRRGKGTQAPKPTDTTSQAKSKLRASSGNVK